MAALGALPGMRTNVTVDADPTAAGRRIHPHFIR